jgi:hypothetical protein
LTTLDWTEAGPIVIGLNDGRHVQVAAGTGV